VRLDAPADFDDTDPSLVHAENGIFTPSGDGRWTTQTMLVTGGPGVAARPGTYRLTATCWLGTNGYDSLNGFEYDGVTITVVDGAPPARPPSGPVPPAAPVPATPAYTG
jgi:hypothetical protein